MIVKLTGWFSLALMLLSVNAVMAQTREPVIDSLAKQLCYYGSKKSETSMFVHLDKTVYVNNETMWFTAYLLNCKAADTPKYQVLSAVLVNNDDKSIAMQGKFVMSAGMAFGNLNIPDTIPPGNYSFIAYTNRTVNNKPEACFVQHITLKTVTQPTFNVGLTLDSLYQDSTNIRVLVQADIKSKPVNGAIISYYLGKDARTNFAGKGKTSVVGGYTLLIPKAYINPVQHRLDVNVKYGTEIKSLYLSIPVKKQPTSVRFYPEGGHLVNNMQNNIGWEVKTVGGTAIKTQGVLYAGHQIIDTIETDSYGMGTFFINPIPNVNYTVRLLADTSQIYTLPAPLNNGAVMHVTNALVNDTLKAQLITGHSGPYTLLVHNYRQLFASAILHPSPRGVNVKVDLSAVPRGLNTLTLLDSLQRPCAERLFFAHYNQKPVVNIRTDDEAGTRQKIKMSIKLNGVDGKPANAWVSVACVQDNRFEVKNDNNIEHYAYLQSELDDLPLKDDLLGNTTVDCNYLNELLLVRGWSKYKWPELEQALPADTLIKQDSLLFSGIIKWYDSALKKAVTMTMIKDSLGMQILNSDAKGKFLLTNQNVYAIPDRKVHLIVNGKGDEYIISVADPYQEMNKSLAKNTIRTEEEEMLTQNTQNLVIKGFEHATNLREVKITTSKGVLTGLQGGLPGVNACGDYVCQYHILNCPNHFGQGITPVVGERYVIPGRGTIIYSGCEIPDNRAGMLSFTGVNMAKEFYGADYTQINPTEPDYLSTIYWKHSVPVSSVKETELSFYTSDITGKYRIVVQGITNEDVIYGESSFTVRKKPQ